MVNEGVDFLSIKTGNVPERLCRGNTGLRDLFIEMLSEKKGKFENGTYEDFLRGEEGFAPKRLVNARYARR